jgi:hypothetical protein
LVHLDLQLCLYLLEAGEDLGLHVFDLLLETGDVVVLDDASQFIDVLHLLLEFALVE